MSLNRFISEVKSRGLARINRYAVEFVIPGGDGESTQLAQLFCETTSLPGMNIVTQPSRTYGEAREIPIGDRNFDVINMSFYVDADLKVKVLFDKWLNSIINPNTRHVSYYKDYITDIKISVVDVEPGSMTQADGRVIAEVDNKPYSVTLHEAYPKSISAIELNADGKGVMKLQVAFQYKYWTSASTTVSRNNFTMAGLPAYGQADPQGVFTGTGVPLNPDVDVTEEMIIAQEDIDGL